MSRRTRYQQGSVQRENGTKGLMFGSSAGGRSGSDGKNLQRKAVVGTSITLPTEAAP